MENIKLSIVLKYSSIDAHLWLEEILIGLNSHLQGASALTYGQEGALSLSHLWVSKYVGLDVWIRRDHIICVVWTGLTTAGYSELVLLI